MEDYKNYTNAELNLKLKSLENEYDVKKNTILKMIEELHELDVAYNEVKKESVKRSNGIWQ